MSALQSSAIIFSLARDTARERRVTIYSKNDTGLSLPRDLGNGKKRPIA